MSLKTTYQSGHVLTKEEVETILKAACDGLSHASYCQVTGCPINRCAIEPAWGDLQFLLESLNPNVWPKMSHEKPLLQVVPYVGDLTFPS